MEKNKMKNMIVLKNLPSNVIEEAFVVFKSNKMTKSYKFIENEVDTQKFDSNYIVKEAEYVIENYLKSSEAKKHSKKNKRKSSMFLKIYSLTITVAFITACFLM